MPVMQYQGKFVATKNGGIYIDLPALYLIQDALGVDHKGYGEYLTKKSIAIPGSPPTRLVISRLFNNVLAQKAINVGLQDKVYEITFADSRVDPRQLIKTISTPLQKLGIKQTTLKEGTEFSVTLADIYGDEFCKAQTDTQKNIVRKLMLLECNSADAGDPKKGVLFKFSDGSKLKVYNDHVIL